MFEPGVVAYEGDLPSKYPRARMLSNETADTWSNVLKPFLTRFRCPTVLDLGCGTGRFSTLIAKRFGAKVIGLDPSMAMLQNALKGAGDGGISYAAAQAERLPLSTSSCDLVWISQVVHHIRDRRACAAELHRILRPKGITLIRGTFGDRLDGFPTLFKFFPGSRQLTARFPTIPAIVETFEVEGFVLQGSQRVRQKTCHSLREFAERTKLRADSTLLQLPDQEFHTCQTALEEAASCERVPSPVIETIELLILRRS